MISPELLQDIEVMADDNAADNPPFIRVRRLQLRHRYRDNRYSKPYLFDMIEGPFVDAVTVVLYYIDGERRVMVGLRHGVRPSIYLRKHYPAKAKLDGASRLVYLELVAGGIEYGDLDSIGINGRAALEVMEEAGFEVRATDMIDLGSGTFSAPGFGMEKLHYRAVEVDPMSGGEPEGDGHPLEEVGDLRFHDLAEAISFCRCGKIADAKTEVGLYRLANHLGYHPEFGLWRNELPAELRKLVRPLGLE